MTATCVQKKQHTDSWGKGDISLCGRAAVITDSHNRPLCLHHYNKWRKKHESNKAQ
jgi:hypothetical protein